MGLHCLHSFSEVSILHVGQLSRTSFDWRLLLRSCEHFMVRFSEQGFLCFCAITCFEMVFSGISHPLTQHKLRACNSFVENKALRGVISLIQGSFSPEEGTINLYTKQWYWKKSLRLENIHEFNWWKWGHPWEGWRSSVGEPDLHGHRWLMIFKRLVEEFKLCWSRAWNLWV